MSFVIPYLVLRQSKAAHNSHLPRCVVAFFFTEPEYSQFRLYICFCWLLFGTQTLSLSLPQVLIEIVVTSRTKHTWLHPISLSYDWSIKETKKSIRQGNEYTWIRSGRNNQGGGANRWGIPGGCHLFAYGKPGGCHLFIWTKIVPSRSDRLGTVVGYTGGFVAGYKSICSDTQERYCCWKSQRTWQDWKVNILEDA